MKFIEKIVQTVGRKFLFTPDKKIMFGLIDYWMVMKEQNDTLSGDCDDFAMTVLWERCDRDLLSFIVNVVILHRFRMYFAMTKTGERHIIGYADGIYFDNWTRVAFPRKEFLDKTEHKIWFFFPSPLMVIPMIVGLFMRSVKR